jgi:Flp pilus assembly pilin Flp
MLSHLLFFARHAEAGQTNMEFGLIASLISVALIAILAVVGTEIGADFNDIKDKLLEVL